MTLREHCRLTSCGLVLLLGCWACGDAGQGTAKDAELMLENATFAAALSEGEGEALDDVPEGDAGDVADEILDDATGDEPEVRWDCSLGAVRQRVMAAYDANGDGKLDANESGELQADLGDLPRMRDRRWARRHRLARLNWLYDADQSGELSEEERQELRNDLETRCLNRQAQLLEQFDANGDGALDDVEVAAARAQARQRFLARRQELLDAFDSNGDGVLGAGERRAAHEAQRQRIAERREQIRQQFDTDGSGDLDEQERARLREALKARVRGEHLAP